MLSRIGRILPLIVVILLAVWWSIDLTLFQGFVELKYSSGLLGPPPSGAYWARDVRISMIVLAAAAFIWAGRGDRRIAWRAVLGIVGWIGLDVLLDRFNVSGITSCVLLAVVACAALIILWRLTVQRVVRPSGPRRGRGPISAAPTGPGVLIVTATVSATLAAVGSLVSSPETALGSMSCGLIVGGLGTIIAIGCAVTASPAPRRPMGVVVVSAVVEAAVLFQAWRRIDGTPVNGMTWYYELLVYSTNIVVALLFAVITGYVEAARGSRGWSSSAAISIVGATVVYWGAVSAMVRLLGAPFVLPARDLLTNLAGNVPISGAGTNLTVAWLAVLVGLIVGPVIAAAAAHSTHRPASQPTSRR
ncbi:hypothetical protein [Pseudonocardia spinosispora]|uniref:hypothetical protein n=1 Tax=Pseudonocardia spinosispora TaxID=103441 RepID=UPI0003FF841F|nr:hypothetical protein [Pseudonocardia spinosispora]